mgnify:CR=1 FL=1
MDLVDRIEKRRFVGREFLLWLWFESEVFEGTISTKEHGEIGLWLEKQIALSAGREVTRIKGTHPAGSREAVSWALLGAASAAGMPGNLPEVTGATAEAVLGAWVSPR